MSDDRRPAVRALCWGGLAVFTLYLLIVNRDYYRADTRIPAYDEAWYLETSLHLYHRLTGEGWDQFVESYRGAFGTKAPLISVLPLPFYLLFGTSQYSAMLVNSLLVLVSNLCLFLLVRRWFGPDVGLAAVVFYQTMPLAYGLSRVYMAEYGLATLVLLFLYCLAASDRLTRGRWNLALGLVLGLGLLMKVLFPAFIAGPLAVTLWLRRLDAAPPSDQGFWLWRACARRPLAAIALPAAALASTWYAGHLGELFRFAWHSAYGEIAPDYSAGGLAAWVQLLINQGMSFYYTAAVVVIGLVALAANARRMRWSDPRLWLLLSWILPPLAALAAGRNQLIRFALPLLPAPAIVLALAVFRLGRWWIPQAALALALAVFPQRLFAALSYPPHGERAGHSIHLGSWILFGRDLGWARPPVWEDPWERRRLLEALRRLAGFPSRPQYVLLALDHPYLNANLLNYLNAHHKYPIRFTTFGYGESSVERALERLHRFDARFLVLGEGFQQLPEFLNRINDQIRARILRAELPFRWRATVPLAHQMKAHVYEREARWASFPPGSAGPRPVYPQPADFAGGVRFLGYDWRRAGERLRELTCYWTARQRLGQDYLISLRLRRGGEVVFAQDWDVADGRHPFSEWSPGEVVAESVMVYLPEGPPGEMEAELWLTAWGVGPPQPLATGKNHAVRWRLVE